MTNEQLEELTKDIKLYNVRMTADMAERIIRFLETNGIRVLADALTVDDLMKAMMP